VKKTENETVRLELDIDKGELRVGSIRFVACKSVGIQSRRSRMSRCENIRDADFLASERGIQSVKAKTAFVATIILLIAAICVQARHYAEKKTEYAERESQYAEQALKQEEKIKTMSDVLETIMLSNSGNYNLYAVDHPIEAAYIEEKNNTSGITVAMISVEDKYKKAWKDEMEHYADLIVTQLDDFGDEDEKELFLAYQKTWEECNEEALIFYERMEENLHAGGTILYPNILRDCLKLYRARAMELIGLYNNIRVGTGWSYKGQWREMLKAAENKS
jgi:hypothetical protein